MKNIVRLMLRISLLFSLIRLRNIFTFFSHLSLFRLIIIIVTLLTFIQVIQRGRFSVSLQKENKYSIYFFLVWLLYAIITLVWVNDYVSWFRSVCGITLGTICIIMYSKVFRTTNDILTSFRLMVIMTIVHNIIGWYEICTNNRIFLSPDRAIEYAQKGYPVSMLYNTNDFALFMLFSVFICYICAANSRSIIRKLIYGIVMFSSIILLLKTSSRANILGLIIGFIVFALFSIKKYNKLIFIITLLFTFLALGAIGNDILFKIQNLTFDFSSNYGSNYIRLNLIKNGLIFLKSTFGFGTGAGNIEYWMDNYSLFNTEGILNIHNWWMEILTGYGIFIFSLYILFYCKLLKSLYYRFKTSNNKVDISISLGIMCIMVGFIISSISPSTIISIDWLWAFWAIFIAFQGCSMNHSGVRRQPNFRHIGEDPGKTT